MNKGIHHERDMRATATLEVHGNCLPSIQVMPKLESDI